jgi:hypothetical protein
MSKDAKRKARRRDKNDLVKDVVGAGAGAVAAIVGGVVAGPPGVAAGAALAFLPLVVGRFIPGFVQRKEREAQMWWSSIVAEDGSDPGTVDRIRARLEEPEAQDTIVEGFREVLDAIAPEVLPGLATLTREYLRDGKRRDEFFRGVGRLLSDLAADEYESLRSLVRALAQHQGPPLLHVRLTMPPGGSAEVLTFVSQAPGQEEQLVYSGWSSPHARRLFHLLKLNALGSDNPGGYWGVVSGPHVLRMNPQIVGRLDRLLCGP